MKYPNLLVYGNRNRMGFVFGRYRVPRGRLDYLSIVRVGFRIRLLGTDFDKALQ